MVAIEGSNAVVFAAGAGPGSGAERKVTMDRDGAIKLLQAAATSNIGRYLMVSGAGVENPPSGVEVFEVYLRAKAAADAALEASDLDWTILRPGGLTDDVGTTRRRRRPLATVSSVLARPPTARDKKQPRRGDSEPNAFAKPMRNVPSRCLGELIRSSSRDWTAKATRLSQ